MPHHTFLIEYCGNVRHNCVNKNSEVSMANQNICNDLKEHKRRILAKLPFSIDDFIIRELKRTDIDIYANWPDYPIKYEMFNTSLKNRPISERDNRWECYHQDNKTISLIVDHKKEKVIGKFSLTRINWEKMHVENVGIRIHPNWCNKGYGTKLLKSISDWCFDNGIEKIKFDVLSTNNRAIKSYRNAGYKIIGEFKCGDAMFYWMESRIK